MSTNPEMKPYDHEPAGNAYLMSLAAVVAGLPLPIVNVIATFIYFMAQRKASYAVRWHSLQALLAQLVVMPFNSIAMGWTLSILLNGINLKEELFLTESGQGRIVGLTFDSLISSSAVYWAYMAFVLLLNIFEFIGVISTAIKVRKGINVRWFGIAPLTDALCSKENRDPYVI